MTRFFFSRFAFAGAKDLHAQDLKRHEKLDGVLGVNLGTGLSAGGGLTLHQELIMTMPGTGKRFTVFSNLLTPFHHQGSPFPWPRPDHTP